MSFGYDDDVWDAFSVSLSMGLAIISSTILYGAWSSIAVLRVTRPDTSANRLRIIVAGSQGCSFHKSY